MKLVGKYTLVLVAALTVAFSILTFYRMERDRAHFEDDMKVDHQVVGHLMQLNAIDIWEGVPASEPWGHGHGQQRTDRMIERANAGGGSTTFAWIAGPPRHA